jgi:hypothetical protein
LCVLVGDERALSLAVSKQESRKRFTGLKASLESRLQPET